MSEDAALVARFMRGDTEDMDLHGYAGDVLRRYVVGLRERHQREREALYVLREAAAAWASTYGDQMEREVSTTERDLLDATVRARSV